MEVLTKKEIKKLKKQIFIDSKDIGLAKTNINNLLKLNIKDVWGELITNIPIKAKLCNWFIYVDKKQGTITVKYQQDVNGPQPEVFKNNLASTERDDNLEYVGRKLVESASCFGTGMFTISELCTNGLTFISRPILGNVWSYTYGENNISEKANLLSNVGVEINFVLKYTRAFGSYKAMVQKLSSLIVDIDNININLGRKHYITVKGFETPSMDEEYSNCGNPLEGFEMTYTNGNTLTTIPEFNGLVDDLGTIHKKVLIKNIYSQTGEEVSVTLKNIKVGKVTKDVMKQLPKRNKDLMLTFVYYEGTNQVAFVIPSRLKGKQVSLNNVLLSCEMSRAEVAKFLTSTSKLDGCNTHLIDGITNKLKDYIWNMYPDTELLEEMVQLLTKELLFTKGSNADSFRKQCNLQQLTKDKCWEWDDARKQDVVRKEMTVHDSRYDITVYHYWKTDGKVDKAKTPYTVIENKRKDFKPADRRQSIAYITKNSFIKNIVAVSSGISEEAVKKWNNEFSEVRTARRLVDVDEITHGIVDVDDFGYQDPDKRKGLMERCKLK